jgi:hypothetical protein
MSRVDSSREKFVTVYVRFYRHHITKKLVFPIPPKKFIAMKIREDRHKAYLERKRLNPKTAA